jgi:hypothetical protein
MTSVVSFSLYGDNPLYCVGAVENARLCAQAYPEWEVRVYTHVTVDPGVTTALRHLGTRVIEVEESFADERETIAKCCFWRFLAIDDPTVEVAIFRDCDSRVSDKERRAVQAWIETGLPFHLMYDHPYHGTQIMAGMWGVRRGAFPSMGALIQEYFARADSQYSLDRYYDQHFLRDVIWSRYVSEGSYIAHGNAEMCSFHRQQGITITPYPAHDGFFPSGEHKQTFIGETVPCPAARPKPPRRPA